MKKKIKFWVVISFDQLMYSPVVRKLGERRYKQSFSFDTYPEAEQFINNYENKEDTRSDFVFSIEKVWEQE